MASGDMRIPAWHGRAKPADSLSVGIRRVQEESDRECSRSEAELNWFSQGQTRRRCRVRRRDLRVRRPAREKKRRLRVSAVAIGLPKPMRVVQRARLWAMIWTASQAALAWKRPEGGWLRPTPYFRSRMAFSISAWRRWSASKSRVLPPL